MTSWRTLFLVPVIAMLCIGCNAAGNGFTLLDEGVLGSGERAVDVRTLPPFTGVRLATLGTLTVELGDRYEIRIEADDNLLTHFVTTVDNDGMLTIKTADLVSLRLRSKLRFTVTVPSLSTLIASSSGDIIAPVLTAERFELTAGSSGDIRLNGIKARAVKLTASSSGDLLIGGIRADSVGVALLSSGDCRIRDGKAGMLDATVRSSGDLECSGMKTRNATVRARSSGDARVWVTGHLRAESSSSGDIRFTGNPERVSRRESSAGDIRRM